MFMASHFVRLGDLAQTRCGDKGNSANIGVVAKDQKSYDWLNQHLSVELVASFLSPLGIGLVHRYELPGICAFNFLIEHALAGGASESLRIDTQGKALGAALMEMRIACPDSEGSVI